MEGQLEFRYGERWKTGNGGWARYSNALSTMLRSLQVITFFFPVNDEARSRGR